jgi:capsular polysaccharide biosynthesis protein
MITAALADEDSNENEENVVANVDDSEIIDETVEKEASNNSKKIANEGYHQKSASADTIEQNSAVSDPQVKEIETMLWR